MIYLRVFVVGGLLCLIAQILMDKFKMQSPYVLVTYVTMGVILTFLGIYDPIVEFGAAGATVPLLGFGYCLANGVKTAVAENGLLGAFTGGIVGAAGGIAAAMFFGYVMAIIFKPKPKP
ncbi:MAG: SpoVA/SpoVAEb family sporulation membrane protein [Clostridioides sp.]|jgi:stage V sporulation protein AE|nr:SpoVA/SpoVAEb family sporulation membrane protein [Clostridioides sp.]